MNSIESRLKLSYSPMTIFEFEAYKADQDISDYLTQTTIYVIAERKLPIMKFVDCNNDGFELNVTMSGMTSSLNVRMNVDENKNYFRNGISAIRTGSNIIDENDMFHSITLYRKNQLEDEFVFNANFDRLVHLSSNNMIKLRFNGEITPFITYRVLYVGQCVGEHIFQRFRAHHALMEILIKENIIPKGYDKVNDLMILPFHIESDVVSVLTGESSLDDFAQAMTGNFTFGAKEISLDCEKALIKAMNPKYNHTRFKQYPKSSDGLYNHKVSEYSYKIYENVVLTYDSDHKILGDVNGLNLSEILISNNIEYSIYNKEF